MSKYTMLDVAKRTGNDVAIGIIEEAQKDIPEFEHIPFDTISGTSFKTYRRTEYPRGAFRKLNEGVKSSRGRGEQITIECFPYEGSIDIDALVLDADDGSLGDMLATEGAGLLRGSMISLAEQFYYATDPNGFGGLIDSVDKDMLINAGGTGNVSKTSVFFINTSLQGVRLKGGKNTALSVDTPYYGPLYDEKGKKYMGWSSPMKGWFGLQVGHTKSVSRIRNITSSNPITQKLMGEALKRFPSSMKPNMIMMNRETYWQWIEERAKVGVVKKDALSLELTGNYENAVEPFMGIPIYVTDAISDSE